MNPNKYYLIGSLLILSGTILLGIMHLAIATYIPNLTGWSYPPGKFATVLNEIMGWFPYILGIVQILIGTILVWNSLSKHN
ncbi:hypothetical protein U5N28_17080 [Lysinibacillus telephonicus]|uniref:Uncharacterized protein n=1 Tax=Lysinibacillus telephonicus TaxID=1714840 RepID=A0A431UDZ2_9BACI|nr:hypothetical protein [Lysinibacillus telephonicus]RTQ87735.1 hypothetical protein EKG35_18705 [Lysinibacillus telephonicus]